MTQTGEPEEYTYYVVFQDSDQIKAPWRWFTRKNFRHCSVFFAVEGATMNINQSMHGIRTWIYPFEIKIVIDHLLENPEYTIVEVKTDLSLQYKNKIGTILPTCVSLTQRLIGITSHSFTPYGYYKYLIKQGAVDMGGLKPKVDNSASLLAQQEQARLAREAEQRAKEAKEREEAEKKRQEDLMKRKRTGRRSLLGTEGDEMGVM
jgi:hypothetical protein